MTEDSKIVSELKITLGQAIDQVIGALAPFPADDRQTIFRAAYAHLNISSPIEIASSPDVQNSGEKLPRTQRKAVVSDFAGVDIKTFKNLKGPSSARQMACVVAYYLAEIAEENERRQIVTTDDIEKYFKQAAFALPTKLEQLLIDSKKAGYFDSPNRGEYKLTRVGHNLVAHQLPVKGKG